MIRGMTWVFIGLVGGCGVEPDNVGADTNVVTGADPVACEDVDGVSFEWRLDPPMTAQVDSASLACTLGEAWLETGALILPMTCASEGAELPRAVTLTLVASPEPPRGALREGAAVTLAVVDDGARAWLRIEDDKGKALIIGAMADGLAPPDTASWWSPYLVSAAATSCLADETDCQRRRIGVDLRRSGGEPTVVQDAGWRVIGDRGEAEAYVAAAWSQDAACADGPGAWFAVGVIAVR